MIQRLLFFLLILFEGFFVNAQYEAAYEVGYPERFCILRDTLSSQTKRQPIEQRDHLLDLFKRAAEKHNDERALLMESFFRFSMKMDHKNFTEKEMRNIAVPVMQRCDELDFESLKAFVLMTMGYYYMAKDNASLSLYYLLKAHSVYSKLPIEAYNFKGVALANLAMAFYKFDDFTRAIQYGKEGDLYPLKLLQKLYNYDVIGMSYLKSDRYDSALLYFDKTRAIADRLGSRDWLGIVNGNKAHVFVKLNRFDSAIHYYRLGIDTTFYYHLLDNTCGFAIGLAKIYCQQNKMTEVAALLPLAQSTTRQAGSEKDRLALYQLLKEYYGLIGNTSKALIYSDSAAMWKDSVDARVGKNLQIQAELDYESERRQAGEKLLNNEISAQRIFRTVSVIIILLVLFIAILIYNRQRLKNKMNEQHFKAQQQQAKQNLELATQQLHKFTQLITEKNKLIELMESQSNDVANIEYINKLQNNTILTEEQWKEFKDLFEKVHTGFFNRLREKYPGLTPAETRFFALAKLKLTNKEMAASLGISTHAVRTIWYRLRKKLNLPEEESWEGLVEEV